jgi:hypothetical protein
MTKRVTAAVLDGLSEPAFLIDSQRLPYPPVDSKSADALGYGYDHLREPQPRPH